VQANARRRISSKTASNCVPIIEPARPLGETGRTGARQTFFATRADSRAKPLVIQQRWGHEIGALQL
jgi:hypothetical protein